MIILIQLNTYAQNLGLLHAFSEYNHTEYREEKYGSTITFNTSLVIKLICTTTTKSISFGKICKLEAYY